jgi:tetratricopeptide (TPR) repeat protein
MTSLAPLLALTLAAVDPCAPVEPVAPDPAAARVYRDVGEAELAAGARDSAAAAYREALARDPSDATSRDALRKLCTVPGPDPYQDGLRRLDAEDLPGAARAFEAAYAADGSTSAALLGGIARYELGEDAQSERLLRLAERDPAHREEARFYLGLLALRAGDGERAVSLLEGAATNPALASPASDLARLASRDGRVILSLLAESGWDSNVNLGPGGPLGPAAQSDGMSGLSASILWRPTGTRGPYLRAGGLLHNLTQLDAYDLTGAEAAAGWQLRAGRQGATAEYEYAHRTLGGDDYLGTHRLLASAWLRRGRALATASYAMRFEDFAGDWSPFSGVLHRAEARAAFDATPRLRLGLAYAAARDATREPVLSYWEHGPRAEGRLLLGRTRLGVDLGVTLRAYDAYDAALGARRSDTYLDGAAFVEVDVAARWTARAGVVGRRAVSNVDALAYDKLAPSVAIGYTLGL